MEGEPEMVMDYYNAMLADRGHYRVQQMQQENGKIRTVSGTGEARFIDIGLLDECGQDLEIIAVGQPVTLRIRFQAEAFLKEVVMGYQIKNRFGQVIFGTNTSYLNQPLYDLSVGETVEYRFRFPAALGEGTYTVSVALHTSDTHVMHNYEWQDLALVFTVINQGQSRFVGSTWLPPVMECSR